MAMDPATHRAFLVRVPNELHRAVRLYSLDCRLSAAEIIRQALAVYLEVRVAQEATSDDAQAAETPMA